VISLDLVDFFPSISRQRVVHFFRAIGWNRKVSEVLADMTTHNGHLPQGAPTSPILSNLVNIKMDHSLASYVLSVGGVYSRYADDVTLSFSDDQIDTHSVINDVIAILTYWGYRPHLKKKLDVRRCHQRQMVTGLVVNETARLPRETRRWLRAVRYRFQQVATGVSDSEPPSLTPQQLQGWIALESMIEARPHK
jgi:RNA-directed DNA polymerase